MKVFAYGRIDAVPSRTWERVLRHNGGTRTGRKRAADLIVVGASAASRPAVQLDEDLEAASAAGQEVVSERTFLRGVGLLSELVPETRTFTVADVAARSRQTEATVARLALFDVVEPAGDLFSFRDLKAATAAAKLLADATLGDLVFACCRMRERLGVVSPLSELNVRIDSDGRIVVGAGERVAEVSGQIRLDLGHAAPQVATLLGSADEAREKGQNEQAIRLLRKALAVSPRDLDVLFELGSLLCEIDQFAEGVSVLRKAVAIRPGFADAWYNIGHALERQRRRDEARSAYESAAGADPTYPDPHYNLGMIDFDESRFADAVSRFEAYLFRDPSSEWAERAKRALALARMSVVKAGAG